METLKAFTTILTTLVVSSLCFCQTQVEVQEVKELKRTGSLSTCGYRATDRETPFLQKLPPSEKTTGSFMDKQEYRIRGKVKQYVSWFGVVRGSSPWFTFTFTDLGPGDHSNPEWAKYCKICGRGRIYKPYPTEDYYIGVLGDPKDFLPKPNPVH